MWDQPARLEDEPRSAGSAARGLVLEEYEHPRYGAPARYVRRWEGGTPEARMHASQRHELDRMRVRELMTSMVAAVKPATPVASAAQIMAERDCGALPVIGENGALAGMVTDRDIALRIVARGRDLSTAVVADCMTSHVFACYANESVSECMRQMARHRVRRLPVVDERGRLVGMLAQSDLARRAGGHASPEERWALTEVYSAISQAAGPSRP